MSEHVLASVLSARPPPEPPPHLFSTRAGHLEIPTEQNITKPNPSSFNSSQLLITWDELNETASEDHEPLGRGGSVEKGSSGITPEASSFFILELFRSWARFCGLSESVGLRSTSVRKQDRGLYIG